MTIALVAHDTKKELMVQFCIAYRQILSEHRLIATGTTGRLVAEATGLNVQRFLPGGHGGDQQIVARIACDEVDKCHNRRHESGKALCTKCTFS